MNAVKVLVVEDEFIVGEDIRRNLITLEYEVAGVATSAEEAIAAVKQCRPDVLLLDIKLGNGMDGIAAAEAIREIVDIPFIYVTAHSDSATFERAKRSAPHAYIIKPFDFKNLHVAIELALHNFSNKTFGELNELDEFKDGLNEKTAHYLVNDFIFIKSGRGFEKVKVSDVKFVEGNGEDSLLCTKDREFKLSLNWNLVIKKLDRQEFMRTHRNYIVNINHIDEIEDTGIMINGKLIPITRKIRSDLLRKITKV